MNVPNLLAPLTRIPEPVRAYVYRVAAVVLGIALAKGWLKPDDVELYLAALPVILAVANTSTKP